MFKIFDFVDFYQSLIQKRKDINLQIDQLKADYQTLEKGSVKAIATIASLRIKITDIQKQILDRSLRF